MCIISLVPSVGVGSGTETSTSCGPRAAGAKLITTRAQVLNQ